LPIFKTRERCLSKSARSTAGEGSHKSIYLKGGVIVYRWDNS
jgi:hypothetical protein